MGNSFSQDEAQKSQRGQNYNYHNLNDHQRNHNDYVDNFNNYKDKVNLLNNKVNLIEQQQTQIQKSLQDNSGQQQKDLKTLSKFSKYNEKNRERIKQMEKKLKELKSLTKPTASEKEQFSGRKKAIQKSKSSRKSKLRTPIKSTLRKTSFESIIKTRRQMQLEENSVNKKLFKDNQFSCN